MEVVEVLDAPNEHLEAEVCTLAAQLAAATCRWLLLIGELDRREAYKEWGCASMAQWLSWKCGLGIVTGREHVRVARALPDLPLIRERFATGVLPFSKVRALTRVATPSTEDSLVDFAEVTTAAQLDRAVRTFERVCVQPDAAQTQLAARSLMVHHDPDGIVTIVARLSRDAAETVLDALRQSVSEVPVDPDDASAEARRADGLEHMAETFLVGAAARRPTEMVIHADLEQLADPARSPVLARLTCDTSLRLAVATPEGEPMMMQRRTRTIPIALRRRLERRDHGCRFPGCTHEAFLHVHHIVHFADDGPTDAANCLTLCSFHHRLVHEGGWNIVGASAEARDLAFRSPSGRVVSERDSSEVTHWGPLPRDPRIDERTIDTADGGRLDLGLAVTALVSSLRPDLN